MKLSRRTRLLLAAMLMAEAFMCGSATANAQEVVGWVQLPATWAWCDYYPTWNDLVQEYLPQYWCHLENDQRWIRVSPEWQNGLDGG